MGREHRGRKSTPKKQASKKEEGLSQNTIEGLQGEKNSSERSQDAAAVKEESKLKRKGRLLGR